MKYKAISVITGEEFLFTSMDRNTLEDLMVDEFNVYINGQDGYYKISYNSATDSFYYQTEDGIYSINIKGV